MTMEKTVFDSAARKPVENRWTKATMQPDVKSGTESCLCVCSRCPTGPVELAIDRDKDKDSISLPVVPSDAPSKSH